MKVIMMTGNPATGKTCTAGILAQELGRVLRIASLSSLEFRRRHNLLALGSEAERDRVYGLLAGAVAEALAAGRHDVLIIDANFNKRHRRELVYRVAPAADLMVVRCAVADERVIGLRLRERRRNLHVYENKAATYELYAMIRDATDPVEADGSVAAGRTALVEYDTARQAVGLAPSSARLRRDIFVSMVLGVLTRRADLAVPAREVVGA